jgi:2-dehydropantoate 2-reductase
MKALLVGAGAVGQVFGRHLQLGGVRVGFLVKERHAAEARSGFTLYPKRWGRKGHHPVRFEGFDVFTTADEVRSFCPDVVMLCLSSTQLRGPWLGDVLAASGNSTLAMLQVSLDDRDYLLARIPEERLISGIIPFLSYHAPLAGEAVPQPGMAYWMPPFAAVPFSGVSDRVRPLVEALRRGGLSARVHPNVPPALASSSVVLLAVICGLEQAGWSMKALREPARLKTVVQAAQEGLSIVEKRTGTSSPAALRLACKAWLMGPALAVARTATPVDLETFFRVHFTKVKDQTEMNMRGYIEDGQKLGLPVKALSTLCGS